MNIKVNESYSKPKPCYLLSYMALHIIIKSLLHYYYTVE